MHKFLLKMLPALPRTEEDLLTIVNKKNNLPLLKKSILQATLESLPISYLVLNEHSTIIYTNENFCNLIGYNREDILELQLEDFVELIVENNYDYNLFPQILSGETLTNYNSIFKSRNGTKCAVELNMYPLRLTTDSIPIGCVVIINPLNVIS